MNLRQRLDRLEKGRAKARKGRLLVFYNGQCDSPEWDGERRPSDMIVEFVSNVDLREAIGGTNEQQTT